MKKKLLSFIIAAAMLMSAVTALAAEKTNRAILLCYDDGGLLVQSEMLKADKDGDFYLDKSLYLETSNKIYFIDEEKFGDLDLVKDISEKTEPSETPEPTEEPEPTVAPDATAKPTSTPKPAATVKPSNTLSPDSPYEKAAEGVYASAIVTGVAKSMNSNEDDVTILTVYYQGKEMDVPVLDSVKISSAPEAFSGVKGETAEALMEGDVICFAANIAGDKIKELKLLFRPTDEDIATGSIDYGTNFEKLYTDGGAVGGQWKYISYGSKASKDKYQYAFGIVAKKNGSTLTLINKSENPDDAVEIDLSSNAYVYSCDVSGKEYSFENGGLSEISTSLPSRILDGDTVELDADYSYNYAFVRLVDGTATDIVVFNNYNE